MAFPLGGPLARIRKETEREDGEIIILDTAHEEPEKTPNGEELAESLTVDGRDLKKAEDDHVEHHWPFPAKLVPCQSEDGSTDGSQKEGEGDGGRDCGVGGLIIIGELDGLDGEGVEVESVRGPRGETDEEKSQFCAVSWAKREMGLMSGGGFCHSVCVSPCSLMTSTRMLQRNRSVHDCFAVGTMPLTVGSACLISAMTRESAGSEIKDEEVC